MKSFATQARGVYYDVPESSPLELDELDQLVQAHLRGEVDAATLQARRVPFGCYEQRQPGTYMVRVRTTGGAITPKQLRAIGRTSSRFGDGSVHITTRQEFQIHGIALYNITVVMRELLQVGLVTRGGGGGTVRNITLSPDSGVGAEEVFDPSPYAFALTSRLIAEADSWALPRKFKIAFSNSAVDTAFAQFNDLGFIAGIRAGVKGFKVYVAGGMGANPQVGRLLHNFLPADEVYAVVAALKRLYAKHGNRMNKHAARLRFTWKTLGEARFRELYEQELEEVRKTSRPLTVRVLPPSTQEVCSLAPIDDDSAEFMLWKRRYVIPQRQPHLYSVVVPAFLGNVESDRVVKLADFLTAFGEDAVRATFGQNLRLRNIPQTYLGNVFANVKNLCDLAGKPVFLANSIACAGADTCQLGICLSKAALAAIVRKLTDSGIDLDALGDFHLNVSGCPNTCGQHLLADLGFYGKVGRSETKIFPAYGVVAGAITEDGAARFALKLGTISARDLPDVVVEVLKTWLKKRTQFHSFASYVDAEGVTDIRAICDRYNRMPEFEEDENYYLDWGSSAVFSLAGRGTGECSSGISG